MRFSSANGSFLLYEIVYHFTEDTFSVFVTLSAVSAVSALHYDVIKALVSEMTHRAESEHSLLVSILHIVIRNDKPHTGVRRLCAYMIQGCRLVDYYSSVVYSALHKNAEMSRRLTCVVEISCDIRIRKSYRIKILFIKAKHH